MVHMLNTLMAVGGLETETLLIIIASVLGGLLLIFLIAFCVTAYRLKKANRRLKGNAVEEIKVVGGVRYSKDDRAVIAGDVNVTHNQGDFILTTGKTYTASKDGKLLPGQYTILSADENVETFNVRVGGFVRECKHFSSIVLNQGDKITAVSHTVILR